MDSAPVTSVYLDALPQLPLYHDRLRRVDGATAVRARWYGTRDPSNPAQQLFIERKVHREAYTDQFSSKERAGMDQGEMAAFLAGQGGAAAAAAAAAAGTAQEGALLAELGALIASMQLVRRRNLFYHVICCAGLVN